MLEYVRAIRDIRPRWFVWENVPGVLSQSGGDAFETFQRELANLGYSLAWRTLDSQFYGVAQRRRRVFVVGHIGENARPAAVLFEPQSLFWDFATREQKRQSLTDGLRKGAQECIGFSAGQSAKAGSIAAQDELAPTLRASESGTNQIPSVCYTLKTGQTGANGSNISEDLAFTLDCSSPDVVAFQPQVSVTQGVYLSDVSPTLDTSKIPAICMSDANTNAAINTELCGTLKVGGEPPIVVLNDQGGDRMTAEIEITGTLCAQTHGNNPIVTDGMVLRRITPVECERLQGFPDNWTKLNDDTKDTPRYKALGNSMAVPVMRWIGKRIQAVDEIFEG